MAAEAAAEAAAVVVAVAAFVVASVVAFVVAFVVASDVKNSTSIHLVAVVAAGIPFEAGRTYSVAVDHLRPA